MCGLGASNKRLMIKDCNVELINHMLEKSVWSLRAVCLAYQPYVGALVGIANLWNEDYVYMDDSLGGNYTLSINLKFADGFLFWITRVCGPNSSRG